MKTQLIHTAAIGALFFAPAAALAQDHAVTSRDQFSGYATIGAAALPEYEGADEFRILPLVDGKLYLGERYIGIEGATLRANVISAEGIELGPVASFTFGRDNEIENLAVARLGNIDDAYEVGAFGAVSFAAGGNDSIRIAVQGVHDVSDVHGGFLISANASYTAAVGERLSLIVDLGATYASDDYADTYFSVSPAGSLTSGLPSFTAKGGLKDAGGQLTATYRLGDNWGVAANASYRRLLGDFADSPVVTNGGNPNQLSGGIGVFYTF